MKPPGSDRARDGGFLDPSLLELMRKSWQPVPLRRTFAATASRFLVG